MCCVDCKPVLFCFAISWMFWGVRGADARIMRANLDGSGIMTVIEYSELNLSQDGEGYPIAMAMDYQLSQLYWVDHNRNSLFSMELDGRSACV